MTAHKHFKQFVRARMAKTGETYSTARRQILRQAAVRADIDPARWHLPGNIPATTALRVLLNAAGVRDRRTGQPFTESMLFGIAGGIGLGLATFTYEKEDFSSFYVTGRHLWFDDLVYLKAAFGRLGLDPKVSESAGSKLAEKHLREACADGSPCIAWVDMAQLPHRGMPPSLSGGGYHVVTVYSVEESRGSALIGDLTDEPVEIGFEALAAARARIKKFKNRVLRVPRSEKSLDPAPLVGAGLKACHAALTQKGGTGPLSMSGLERLRKWEAQLGSSKDKDRWDQIFPRGCRLWQGLSFVHDFIENYHTGGGLSRPLFAEFLAEAAEVPGWEKLRPLSERYAALGAKWSEMALSAIPQDVPAFRDLRELCVQRAELRSEGKRENVPAIGAVWTRLGDLQEKARGDFPLSESRCTELRLSLLRQVTALREAEITALAAIGDVLT
jgi:hypothetical protein